MISTYSEKQIDAVAEGLMQFDGVDIERYPFEKHDGQTKQDYRNFAVRVLDAAYRVSREKD